MQQIERCLQVSIALMAVLATWMMSLGGDIPMMTPLITVVAFCSVIFTDLLGWFSLHRYLVNAVAIAAMLLTLTDFLEHDSTGQLLSIAYLLISWEAVMLFQRKTARVYWCIAVLSLLQVVVASVLNLDLKLGILLFTYLIVGFFGLVFFFLARELHRVDDRRRDLSAAEGPIFAIGEATQGALASKLPLAKLFRTVAGLGAMSVVFAIVFFYGSPRVGGNWSQRGVAGAQTGFTSNVSLKEMGKILQNHDPVMRVSFNRFDNDSDYRVYSDLYFHGAVLNRYRNGEWKSSRSHLQTLPIAPRNPPPDMELVRVNVTLEPTVEPTLFSMLPLYRRRNANPRNASQQGATFSEERQCLTRDQYIHQSTRYRYQFVTSALRRGLQNQVRPHSIRPDSPRGLSASQRHQLLTIDPRIHPGLVETAAKIAADAKSKYQITQALTNHFLISGQYTYTLNFDEVSSMRNPQLDPIEDFVTNHHHGHCEYFASALTLMLRSQGVPARLAVGYHGGERNKLSGDVRVLQSHAHAWVEAYLEPDDIPSMFRLAMHNSPGGGWLRLDPTPPSDLVSEGRNQFDDVLDFAQILWTDYVLEMNPQRQRETLEQAIGVQSSDNVSGAVSTIRGMTRRFIGSLRDWVGGNWFSWRAGVLTSGVLLAGIAVGRILYPIFAWLSAALWSRRRATNAVPRIEFYDRLEKLLRRIGATRTPSQTQLEFAASASELLKRQGMSEVANVPLLVAQAFYDVRFGESLLNDHRQRSIDAALRQLAESIEGAPQH